MDVAYITGHINGRAERHADLAASASHGYCTPAIAIGQAAIRGERHGVGNCRAADEASSARATVGPGPGIERDGRCRSSDERH